MNFTAHRILDECPEHAQQWLVPLDEEAKKKLPGNRLWQRLSQGVERAVDRVSKDMRGAAILVEWLGQGGKPVATIQAMQRAEVCVKCPYNRPRTTSLEAVLANAIQAQDGMRHNLSLKLPQDPKLHTCEICGCYLKLKVWVPTKHLISEPKVVSKLPDWCWIVQEKKKANHPKPSKESPPTSSSISTGVNHDPLAGI
jgi:hypothetical protein